MADPFVQLRRSTAQRIIKGIRKIEAPPRLTAPDARPGRALPPAVRVILLEPLYPHGQALAMRSARVTSHSLQEVSLLTIGVEQTGTFRLFYAGVESLDIAVTATADDFLLALAPWPCASEIEVSGGAIDPEVIPDTLAAPGVITEPFQLYRWLIAFTGPSFESVEPDRVLWTGLDDLGTEPGQVNAVVVTFPSRWEPTGEIVEVFEGGLLRQSDNSNNYQYQETGYGTGSILLCTWLPDAGGYVPMKFENRVVQDYRLLWESWIRQHAWAEFTFPDDSYTSPTAPTIFHYTTGIESGWNIGTGWGLGNGWTWGGYSWWGNYGWGPYQGRPVKVRPAATLPPLLPGTLPSPLLEDTIYYLVGYHYGSHSFQLATTPTGTGITVSGGTGVWEILLYGDPNEVLS